jgi:hypothetical protein
MGFADLIPTGRTSLIKRGKLALQVQTEYAHRPYPRITTTVQKSGQVIQKIERNLDRPIASIEEKDLLEDRIRKQHAEILGIIDKNRPITAALAASPPPAPIPPAPHLTTLERLEALPGRHRVFRLDNEGNFVDAAVSKEFKHAFSAVFKNLRDLLTVFTEIPGVGLTRESGVYEIERNELYLLSAGTELYFFHVELPDYSVDYEKLLREAMAGASAS